MDFYWPVVVVVCICFLATLYHVSVPVRTNWSFNLPGATFSLVVWIVGSYLLRWVLTATAADSRSIYGPLSAPIAVLIWLYLVAIAVLIGAAVNAAFDTVFPQKETTSARLELVSGCGRGGRRTSRPVRLPRTPRRSTRFAPCLTTPATCRAATAARWRCRRTCAPRGGSSAAGCSPRC